MAVQAWHPELEEDDRRRSEARRRPRRSPIVFVLWGLIALLLLLGVGLGFAWFSGALTGAPRTAANAAPGGAVAQQPAQAAAPQPTITRREAFGDWIYLCVQQPNGAPDRCLITQQLSNSETRQPIFTWRILENGQGGLIGEWETPTGVVVGRGIVLDAGTEKPIAIPFQACAARACLAVANLAPDFIQTLSTTAAATATVFPIGGDGVRLNLSVKGLAQGLAALKQSAPAAPTAAAAPAP